MSGAIQFGKAVITLGIDDKTQADMRKWASSAKAFAVASAAIGGATFALKSFADQGSRLQDIADRTGLAASQLSALGYAARQSGTDIDAMQTGLSKMSRLFTDASEESKSAVDALHKLGLTAAQLQSMNVNDRFLAIADAISKVDDPSVRAAYVMEIFGRSAQALIPLLSQGREGITRLTEEAKRLGLVWSDDMAAAAAKLDDDMQRLNDQWNMLVANAGTLVNDTGLVGWLAEVAAGFTRARIEANKWDEWIVRKLGGKVLHGLPGIPGKATTPDISDAGRAAFLERARRLQSEFDAAQKPHWFDSALTAGTAEMGRREAEAGRQAQREAEFVPGVVTVERIAEAVEDVAVAVRQSTESPAALDARSVEAYKQAFANQFSTSDKQLEIQRRILQQLQKAPIVLGEA